MKKQDYDNERIRIWKSVYKNALYYSHDSRVAARDAKEAVEAFESVFFKDVDFKSIKDDKPLG